MTTTETVVEKQTGGIVRTLRHPTHGQGIDNWLAHPVAVAAWPKSTALNFLRLFESYIRERGVAIYRHP